MTEQISGGNNVPHDDVVSDVPTNPEETEQERIREERSQALQSVANPQALMDRGVLTLEEAQDQGIMRSLKNSLWYALVASDEADPLVFGKIADESIRAYKVFGAKLTNFSGQPIGFLGSSTRGSVEHAELNMRFAERWAQVTGVNTLDEADRAKEAAHCALTLFSISGAGRTPRPDQMAPSDKQTVLESLIDAVEGRVWLTQNAFPMLAKEIDGAIGSFHPDDVSKGVEMGRIVGIITKAAVHEGVTEDKLSDLFYMMNGYRFGHILSEERAAAFLDIVLPLILDDDSSIQAAIRKGNVIAVGEGNFGIGDFTSHAYTSPWTPGDLNELQMAIREVPATDSARFEQNRIDALVMAGPFGGLRDFIHDQQPGVHEVLKAMIDFYDSKNGDGQSSEMADDELRAVIESRMIGAGFSYTGESLYDLRLYDAVTEAGSNPDKLTNIEILRRLEMNTRVVDTEPPETSMPQLNTAMQLCRQEATAENVLSVTTKLIEILEVAYAEQKIGVEPNFVKALAWIDKAQSNYLAGLRGKSQSEILDDPTFQAILRATDMLIDDDYSRERTEAKLGVVTDKERAIVDRKRAYLGPVLTSVGKLAKAYKERGKTNWSEALWSGNTIHDITVLAQNP